MTYEETNEIYNKYINDKYSLIDVCKLYKKDINTVKKYFKKYDFSLKSKEQVKKEKSEKIKQTNIKKYGVENVSQVDFVKEKRTNTFQEKYGVNNPSKSDNIKKKKEETFKLHYGCKTSLQDEKVKEKIKHTNMRKYGVKYPSQNKEIKNKIKNSVINKYGVENVNQSIVIKNKSRKSRNFKTFNLLLQKIKNEYDFLDEFKGVHPYKWIPYKFKCLKCNHVFETPLYQGQPKCPICYPVLSGKSKLEDEIEIFINSLGFKTQRNLRVLNKKEIDIFIPEKQIGIEINSLYYHNSNPESHSYKDKTYHKQKTDLAREKNIRLIHIWDCFNIEIYKSMIKNLLGKTENKIYARECQVKNITKEEETEFLSNNHIHGYTASYKSLGLFYNDELVSVISFRKCREGIEIARFASKLNTNVIGGFSRLLKHSNINESLITYCDIEFCPNKEDSVYFKNGFKFIKETNPKLYFTDFKQVYSRQEFMKHKLKDKLERYDENLTAEENLFMNDIYPVYSTGNWKFIKKFK